MRSLAWTLTFSLLVPDARAAVKDYPVKYRVPIVEDGSRSYETRHQHFPFRLEILGDDDSAKGESHRGGRPFVDARPGERYSIRVYNPLPVRVAVNLTVDGLNSITGKPSGIADGEMWMIEPESFIVLRGWQVNQGESRCFYFTDKPKSYASWQGERHHMDLAANCGVIGAAFFWSHQELQDYYESHPVYRYSQAPRPWTLRERIQGFGRLSGGIGGDGVASAAPSAPASALDSAEPRAAKKAESEQQAGTGMGERESHLTQQVEFRFDEGMYRASQALLVYYDFPKPAVSPNPFPSMSFAAEMPGDTAEWRPLLR